MSEKFDATSRNPARAPAGRFLQANMAMIVALPLFSLAATSGPGTLPAPAYDASANGECDRLLPVL